MNEEKIQSLKVPAHIAIIMDGNGRWAKKRGMPRTFGHSQGAKVVEQILEDADHIGVKYLTVYAFSTENWSRPQTEVKALMNLLRRYMKTSLAKCAKNNVRVRVIGDKSMLDQDLQDSIADLERDTAANTGIGFQIAINYGGRDEIVRELEKEKQRIVIFLSFVIGAVISPTPDIFTQSMIAVPLILLYELSYLVVRYVLRR